ncbi:hypothetical protein Ahy_B09g100210 [Arachis hypogaea]|uniref:Uncharacterized protein n=1 Tax=Arachis hypogaea TaxID=3818 RepID=A0A444XW22_ARAHY|nr:hypothetical protein Ahy_B09g100210 [Arachis hypogaea]
MTQLSQLSLHKNQFTGGIPNLCKCDSLFDLQLRDNKLTGVVPSLLMALPSLKNDPVPVFRKGVQVRINVVGGIIGVERRHPWGANLQSSGHVLDHTRHIQQLILIKIISYHPFYLSDTTVVGIAISSSRSSNRWWRLGGSPILSDEGGSDGSGSANISIGE